MQYRVLDRQKLAYVDSGYVVSYEIDNDYIVNNNSKIYITKKTNALVGDVIFLIKTSGAYSKGIITAVDNAALTISYKPEIELFNDDMANIYYGAFAEDETLEIAARFGTSVIAEFIKKKWAESADPLVILPMVVLTDGDVLNDDGEPNILWKWSDSSFNFVDWLVELFEDYNVMCSWTIDFNIAEEDLSKRKPQYIVTVKAITSDGRIIKDNVEMQTITYTEDKTPDATVCYMINEATGDLMYESSGKNLLNPKVSTEYSEFYAGDEIRESETKNISNYISVDETKSYTFSQTKGTSFSDRYFKILLFNKQKEYLTYLFQYNPGTVGSYKYTINLKEAFDKINKDITEEDKKKHIGYVRIEYSVEATELQFEEGEERTEYDPFSKKAIYYLAVKENGEYYIDTDINNEERVRPVQTIITEYDTESDDVSLREAAESELIPSKYNHAVEIDISSDSKMFDFENSSYGDSYKIINENGSIDTILTGRKESSNNKTVTLYFGLGRKNYTDKIQIQFRKQRYSKIYNSR